MSKETNTMEPRSILFSSFGLFVNVQSIFFCHVVGLIYFPIGILGEVYLIDQPIFLGKWCNHNMTKP
ncbi:unnamed protein product [Trifolium pratense]|uniref:Uncharacterized protein n=1 Tax=Trifolium pratense TaxID=57577 RepID=A0ACB0I6P3_TRIPR|nr:unnamed protein product [Trifolium pratense]